MPPRSWLTTLAAAALLPMLAQAASEQRYPSEDGQLTVNTVADGLRNPWALAFLPGSRTCWSPNALATCVLSAPRARSAHRSPVCPRYGRKAKVACWMWCCRLSSSRTAPCICLLQKKAVMARGTAVGRGQLSEDKARLENFTVIFRQMPKLSDGNHFGSRLVFDRNGYLFIALGENNQRPTSQDLDKLQGKIVRILPDGEVPKDNPFVGKDGVRPEIWSFGHRNQQGAALNPWTGKLWTHEHGPRGGDEINIPQAGKNYGWPMATHGINYSLLPIPEAKGKHVDGMVDPHHVWEKSPASAAWPSMIDRPSRPGTTICSSAPWRLRS